MLHKRRNLLRLSFGLTCYLWAETINSTKTRNGDQVSGLVLSAGNQGEPLRSGSQGSLSLGEPGASEALEESLKMLTKMPTKSDLAVLPRSTGRKGVFCGV